jgi:hypothetical protein
MRALPSQASDLVDKYTSWGTVNDEALGQRLFELAWMSPDHYAFVVEVMDELWSITADNVASAFVRNARDSDLDEFARTNSGRDMLRRLKKELLGGITTPREGGEAVRLFNAINRAEGAEEGRAKADAALDAAAAKARATPGAVQVQPVDPSQIGERIRLINLVLDRLWARYEKEPALNSAITTARDKARGLYVYGPRQYPDADAAKVAVAQVAVERADRSLTQLDAIRKNLAADEGASQMHSTELVDRVRNAWIDVLSGAFEVDVATRLNVADALAAALPRALTDVELGILSHRQAGYSLTQQSGEDLIAWVKWVQEQLDSMQAEANAIAADRQKGIDVEKRQAALLAKAEVAQLSIEGIQHWDRGLSAYEFLAGGFNIIPIGYEAVGKILQRCEKMKAAALRNDLDDLRQRVVAHRNDQDVQDFYKVMPAFLALSGLIAGMAILLVAIIATAGVAAVVAVPEGAGVAAVLGASALEALAFTTVSRTLQGAIAPPSKLPFLADLALNFGLFSILRFAGPAIKSALAARGMQALTGAVTNLASFGLLEAFGILHFRLEEGRWPTGDEIAMMTATNIVMMVGLAVLYRPIGQAVQNRAELKALEKFHARYGERVAGISLRRTRLAQRYMNELAAGRGDDQTVIADLRAESQKIEADLKKLIDEVLADKEIGIENLRKALAVKAIEAADISSDLLTRSFQLPRHTGLRRAGGEAMYTFEFGAADAIEARLKEMGGTVTKTVGPDGLHSLVAEFPDRSPMYFLERPEQTQAALRALADIIEQRGATKAQRAKVIGDLRTPHDQAPGELEGFVLDSVMAENQRAIADLVADLTQKNPDVIVGMEQGGAFLADVVGGGSAKLAPKVRHMPVHKDAQGKKFDGPAMVAEFEALIAQGAKHIVIVDSYMGGTTASALRDQVLLPLVRKYPDVKVDVQWMRESLGFENRVSGGTTVLPPRRGQTSPTQPGASQITGEERAVRLTVGDDMSIVYNPESHEPIMIFDRQGRITHVYYPRQGQTTRQLLIELLNQKPGP